MERKTENYKTVKEKVHFDGKVRQNRMQRKEVNLGSRQVQTCHLAFPQQRRSPYDNSKNAVKLCMP
jgi:hypothetical protein